MLNLHVWAGSIYKKLKELLTRVVIREFHEDPEMQCKCTYAF